MQPGTYHLRFRYNNTFRKTFRLRERLPDGTKGDPIDLTGYSVLVSLTKSDGTQGIMSVNILDQVTLKGCIQILVILGQVNLFGTHNGTWSLDLVQPNTDRYTYLTGDVYPESE